MFQDRARFFVSHDLSLAWLELAKMGMVRLNIGSAMLSLSLHLIRPKRPAHPHHRSGLLPHVLGPMT